MLLSLWYSDSTVNAFFKFLISLYFPSNAVSDIFSLFDTFSHFRNLKKCVHRRAMPWSEPLKIFPYYMAKSQGLGTTDPLPNLRIWLAEFDIEGDLDFPI